MVTGIAKNLEESLRLLEDRVSGKDGVHEGLFDSATPNEENPKAFGERKLAVTVHL